MLFVTVNELRKRFPECNIYFASGEEYLEELYTFIKLDNSPASMRIAREGFSWFSAQLFIKDVIKRIIGRKDLNFMKCSEQAKHIKECMKTLDAVIDISGFALGSKWGNIVNPNKKQ